MDRMKMKGWICKYEIDRGKNLGWAVQDEMSRDEMYRRPFWYKYHQETDGRKKLLYTYKTIWLLLIIQVHFFVKSDSI